MASSVIQAQLGQTLVDFSSNGIFPEEDAVSAATLEDSTLPAALDALNDAKAELQREVRQISRESAPDVDSWIANAKSLQNDIENSRRLASDIVRQAKANEHREETLRDKQNHVEFLSKEMSFNSQLLEALRSIQRVNDCLDKAEELIEERKILDALRMLEDAWKIIAEVPAEKDTRALKLLDEKCFKLRGTSKEHLIAIWNHLIHVDFQEQSLTINKTLPHEPTSLDEALVGLKAYKELDKAAIILWENLDRIVLAPRTDLRHGSLPSISIRENSVGVGKGLADHTIKSLFHDMEAIIRFLSHNLPLDLVTPLSHVMMPVIATRIKDEWLDTAVPSSLDDMIDYQKALAQVDDFATMLQSLDWPGVASFNEWVSNSPKIWLSKRRENALDWIRNELSLGIGPPQFAERVESRMLEKEEGTHLATINNIVNQDWDAAWDSDENDESTNNGGSETPSRNKHSLEEERRNSEVVATPAVAEDDAADTWGWGDEDEAVDLPDTVEPEPASDSPIRTSSSRQVSSDIRQVTMSEKYWTSSMPQPVMRTVVQIFEDGAKLIRPESEHIPVAPAAPGIFSLPTLILAMYRAVGPFYYSTNPSGNMFLYNDATWLAGQLKDFVTKWNARDDLPPRAYGMVRLESEISVMESFGKRAYTSELNAQRTIINDLLGGTQNFFQDDSSDQDELKQRITMVIGHIRSKAVAWEQILSPSAQSSAIGSLVNAIAIRIINDIFDMSSMSVAEAESTATVISLVEKLDDLFLPKPKNGQQNGRNNPEEEIPMTAQFADQWMKMKYLSQTLQSNLTDIHFLWFESELSLYFTVEEVVDLIELSFENNAQVRHEIRQIRENPNPVDEV